MHPNDEASLSSQQTDSRQHASGYEDGAGTDWSGLVDRLRSGDLEAMEDLYRIFYKGIRYYFCRQLGAQELEDKVHDTFVIVVQAIRRGELREPERLMGFVRTIVRRQVAAYIEDAVQQRREHASIDTGIPLADVRHSPEDRAVSRQQFDFMLRVLRGLSQRDREILTRFYLREQSQEQICHEMNLTDTQFRLLKSRAKARFTDTGKKKLQARQGATSFLVRTVAGLQH